MRIVGGRHRSRALIPIDDQSVRPTTDRTREAMFNILCHRDWGPAGANAVDGAVVLDAFLGSGALALEALSRGADRATGFDISAKNIALARKNAGSIGESSRMIVRRADALKPPKSTDPATLIFLDPPYGKNLIEGAAAALETAGWIAPCAILVTECAADEDPGQIEGFDCLNTRVYAGTRLGFWRKTDTEPTN